MHKVKLFSSIAVGAIIYSAMAYNVFADTCTSQYGGYNDCNPSNISINKKVQNPAKTGEFVENVTSSMTAYSVNMDVLYELTVTNNSNQDYDKVDVKDVFPSQVDFVSGPGNWDNANHTLFFTTEKINKGQSKTYQILGKVGPASRFGNNAVSCEVVNTATVAVPERRPESDSSSICVQTKVLGSTTLPVAGFNDLFLLIPFFGIGLTGVALTRKK